MPQFIFYLFIAIISVFLEVRNPTRRRSVYYNDGNDITILSSISDYFYRRNRRIKALKTAQNYLKPYTKIFGNLTLSNKFCTLTVYHKDKKVMCMSTVYDNYGKKMLLVAKNFSPLDCEEYFDMMCDIFSYNTKYSDIQSSLRAYAVFSESVYSSKTTADSEPFQGEVVNTSFLNKEVSANKLKSKSEAKAENAELYEVLDELTDINNCSEAELTSLPGISIIVAKKIINFRENERPFKSVEDFLSTMKIKPHFAKQLRKLVCVKKVNMKKFKKAKAERIIDL